MVEILITRAKAAPKFFVTINWSGAPECRMFSFLEHAIRYASVIANLEGFHKIHFNI